MLIQLITIGQWKESPEKNLYEYYKKQLKMFKLELVTLQEKKGLTDNLLIKAECKLISQKINPSSIVWCLDERGENLTSRQFAQEIAKIMDLGKNIQIIIGGAGGLDDSIRNKANKIISFGKLTWPHMLIRAMISEQIYRAQTIITNHPYHRD